MTSTGRDHDWAFVPCPYGDCTFRGTQNEVDEHIVYLTGIDDPDHRPEKRPA
jgi:hypothetical protein